MALINITVEGQSEQKFCNELLGNYLYSKAGHILHATPITTNLRLGIKGGAVEYAKFKAHLLKWMRATPNQFHTMFFDLYALPNSYPNAAISLNGIEKASSIANAIAHDINSDLFIPYIQVHEFETLLYAKPEILVNYLEASERVKSTFLSSIANFQPEEINGGVNTAPSKRILEIDGGYRKILTGYLVAQEIGIDNIREGCPHFNNWVQTLIDLP